MSRFTPFELGYWIGCNVTLFYSEVAQALQDGLVTVMSGVLEMI
jgi:hypothetical protein